MGLYNKTKCGFILEVDRLKVRLKRAYEPASKDDGVRILVERLWPRGLTKEKAAIDIWMKDVSPSPELRKWFSHDFAKWDEFRHRYIKELENNHEAVMRLVSFIDDKDVTFVYSASDPQHNSAILLADFISRKKDGQ